MTQHHLFVIDPLPELNYALDTSMRIAHALERRGHRLSVAKISDLVWDSINHGGAHAQTITFGASIDAVKAAPPRFVPFRDFTAIHMRKDPPFDLDYVGATWLLDAAKDQCKIYNSPEALRSLNEKLAILEYPEASRPAVVASNPQELLRFVVDVAHGDAVVKPLNLFGGRGVSRLTVDQGQGGVARALEFLTQETDSGRSPRMVQGFDKAIFDGEVRVFAVGGKALAWCLKVPAKGNFLANTRAGAVLKAYKPTSEEQTRANSVAAKLAKRGIQFVGFDMIGGYISEVNITSPRLLVGPTDTHPYYDEIADWVESDCKV